MKNYIEKTLNNIKKINICEKVILAFFIVIIIFLPIGKLPVDVKITYEGSNELKEKNAIVYIDSGKNYNDDEGYVATIKNDKTCIAHIKNYIYPVSVRIDPIDDMTVLGISKIDPNYPYSQSHIRNSQRRNDDQFSILSSSHNSS